MSRVYQWSLLPHLCSTGESATLGRHALYWVVSRYPTFYIGLTYVIGETYVSYPQGKFA